MHRRASPSARCTQIWGIIGFSSTDLWVVANSFSSRFNGTTGFSLQLPTCNSLDEVWGTSPTDVWAVGDNGTILHHD